ncbi:MAG TPA: hypothetical protein VGG20_10275 [Thermoanaerobaculia bacterium]|jgi:hypothetical protein
MRKLAYKGALVCLALGMLGGVGCNGSSSTPSEPTPATRGNWIGTITGVHSAIHLNGTCTLEMQLSPIYQGQWWVDCPGGSSTGQVSGVTVDNLLALALVTTTPASNCPWSAVTTVTASTIDGTFQVVDCTTNKPVSSGTLTLRRR